MDIFSGGVKTKEEIIKEVLNILNYGTKEEQGKTISESVNKRKAASVQQDGTAGGYNRGEENRRAGVQDNDGRGNSASITGREPGDLAQTEEINYQLSNEVDENGHQFVLNSDGNIEFGRIGEDTGLTQLLSC